MAAPTDPNPCTCYNKTPPSPTGLPNYPPNPTSNSTTVSTPTPTPSSTCQPVTSTSPFKNLLQNPDFENPTLAPWVAVDERMYGILKNNSATYCAHRGNQEIISAPSSRGLSIWGYELVQSNITIPDGSTVYANYFGKTFTTPITAHFRLLIDGKVVDDQTFGPNTPWTQVGTGNTGPGLVVSGALHNFTIQAEGSVTTVEGDAFGFDDASLYVINGS